MLYLAALRTHTKHLDLFRLNSIWILFNFLFLLVNRYDVHGRTKFGYFKYMLGGCDSQVMIVSVVQIEFVPTSIIVVDEKNRKINNKILF